jgi:hypothetical protein
MLALGSSTVAALFSMTLLGTLILMVEVGRRVGIGRSRRDAEGARAGLGAVEGALFGLLGLLIAFTFSGAASRFDARRAMIVEEANDIGTAYLRLDLLPPSAQPELRAMFRRYVDLRLELYHRLSLEGDVEEVRARITKLQGEIWTVAVRECQKAGSVPTTSLLLPALNSMFDITSSRWLSVVAHPPMIVFGMLTALALAGALFAGFGMAGGQSRSWLHILGFAGIMAATVYVILDLEFPRRGLIRLDSADRFLIEVRDSMK